MSHSQRLRTPSFPALVHRYHRMTALYPSAIARTNCWGLHRGLPMRHARVTAEHFHRADRIRHARTSHHGCPHQHAHYLDEGKVAHFDVFLRRLGATIRPQLEASRRR